ncbi:MAG: BatA domain-containing protein [Ignavibacteriaceae bacterium]
MIFLNPAVLFGLLAASIPILIHLFNLRKLKRIEFSTLRFLKELQKNKIRKIKLKQWLLLALRVLIILFLVTAFARPTLKGVAIGGTTSAAKTTAIFILDDTFSMSVVNQNGSYFNQAKETIKKLLAQLQQGDEAALVLVSRKDEEVKTTSNLIDFQKQVEASQISYSSGLLHPSIIKAAKILSSSKNFNKEIYILSDFQLGRLADENSLSDLGELLDEKIKLYSFNYSGKEVFNVGIDDLKVNTQIFEKDKPVSFNITITNYSSKNINDAVVSLFANGERSGQQSVSLNPGETKILTIESIIKSTGYINVFAEIEDDDINYDNKRYSTLFIPSEIPVIIFDDNDNDSRFVELALTSSENERSIKVITKNLNQISAYNLSSYDAVIIIGSEKINNLDRLKSYVENGGGLLLMPGENSTLQNFQKVTNFLGFNSPSASAGELNNLSSALTFDNIEFNHPIFQNIFFNKEKKKIESPEIYFHFYQKAGLNGKNIISLIDGSSFLSEYKIGKGKVFLFNSAPVLSWSNFALKSFFVPLINKSIYYLSSQDRTDVEFTAGNNIDINLGNISSPQIKIERPDDTEEFINLEESSNRNFLSYNKTYVSGNYKIYSGNNLIKDISVNHDPLESVTKYLTVNQFEEYLKKINFKGNYFNVDKIENPEEVILQSRFGSELWKYFLLVALILALIEMTIARNSKKEIVNKS